jgi:hypothetical protein
MDAFATLLLLPVAVERPPLLPLEALGAPPLLWLVAAECA